MTDSRHWLPIWESKANEDIARASGRSNYGQTEVRTLVEDALMALCPGRSDSLLDIGCAAGLMGEQLRGYYKRYVGLDYSAGAVQRFAKRCNVETVCASATALPFRDGEFTQSLMSSVLLCLSWEESGQALREMRRVTTKVGFVSGNLERKGPNDIDPSRCPEGCRCNAHCTWFWTEELVQLAVESGWSKAEVRRIDPSLSHSAIMFDMRVEA